MASTILEILAASACSPHPSTCFTLRGVAGGVELSLDRGEILGLVGPNGCGKSAFIKSITGLEISSGGENKSLVVELDGVSTTAPLPMLLFTDDLPVLDLRRTVVNAFAAWDHHHPATGCDLPRVEHLLHEFGLWEWRKEVLARLSQGILALVKLVLLLVVEPQLLILDEPAQYLDTQASSTLIRALKRQASEKQAAILVATRRADFALAVCDRVAVIRQGKVILTQSLKEPRNTFQGELYRIKIHGEIDTSRADWLGGAVISQDGQNTTLWVRVPDQVALHGFFAQLQQLAIGILSAERVEPRLDTALPFLMHAPFSDLPLD